MTERMEITMKLNDDKGLWIVTCRWRGQLAFAMAHPDKAQVEPFYDLLVDAEKAGPAALVAAIMGLKTAAEIAGCRVAEAETEGGDAVRKAMGEE